MNTQPDFIELRFQGPYSKDAIRLSVTLLVISIISLAVHFFNISIDSISVFGVEMSTKDGGIIRLIQLIAIGILFLFFQLKAIPDYYSWRREVKKADEAQRKLYRNKRREPISKEIENQFERFDKKVSGSEERVKPSNFEEDLEDQRAWEEGQWNNAKWAYWTAYFKMFFYYALPTALAPISVLIILLD